VHRPLRQQHQDGCAHVTAAPAAASATAETAARAAEARAEPEAWASETEARAPETRAESRRSVVAARVVAKLLEEFSPGMPPRTVQRPPLGGSAGCEAESESRTGTERPAGGSEWSVHVGRSFCV
jgi:hypothetical protein